MREARLINYYQRQDTFFQYKFWPEWVQVDILEFHKQNKARWNLMYYFLANGLEGDTARKWVMAYDCIDGTLMRGDYDYNACADFSGLIRKYKEGKLFKGNKLMYDMIECKVVIM